MDRRSNSLQLETALSNVLSLELLRRAVKANGAVDTNQVMIVLKDHELLPQHICKRLADELADLLAFRRDDAVANGDRHMGRGWSEKVIHQRMLLHLKNEIASLMNKLQEACEEGRG